VYLASSTDVLSDFEARETSERRFADGVLNAWKSTIDFCGSLTHHLQACPWSESRGTSNKTGTLHVYVLVTKVLPSLREVQPTPTAPMTRSLFHLRRSE